MPRKRKPDRFSVYSVHKSPTIDPEDPNKVTDHDLVRHALVNFDELADLPSESREQLVEDLVKSICFARGGVKAGKQGVSDKALGKQIFLSDVGRALERVGLSATRWRKTYEGDGPDIDAPESFFFRLARELANVFGITLPKDLKLPGMRAAQHQYEVMLPAMKAAQDAELLARGRQRLDGLVVRLQAAALKVQG
jgi:hypothetical protein